jgi:hypothetical protein
LININLFNRHSTAPKLTYLEWFNPPQLTVMAGEKLQTFSAAGDEAVTDRVKLEEKRNTFIPSNQSISFFYFSRKQSTNPNRFIERSRTHSRSFIG